MKISLEKNYWKILAAIFISYLIIYPLLIDGKNIWCDEVFSMELVEKNYSGIWESTASDVHPPLYYWMLKSFLSVFGYGIFQAKLFSEIGYFCVLILGSVQVKQIFDKKTALFFCLLWGLYPFCLRHAYEIRMYPWAAFFVFSSAVFAYHSYYRNKMTDWVFLALSTLAAAYTHYFALVSVGIIYFVLMIAIIRFKKRQSVPLFLSLTLIFLAYLPWMGEFINQLIVKVNNEYWIDDITFFTVLTWAFALFDNTNFMGNAIVLLITVVLGINLFKNGKSKKTEICKFLLFIPGGTALVGLIASILIRPVFVSKYLLPSTPCFVLFIAIALNEVKRKDLQVCAFSMIITVYLMTLYDFIEIERYEIGAFNINADFVSKIDNQDCFVVITDSSHPAYILSYFERKKHIFDEAILNDLSQLNSYDSIVCIIDADASIPDLFMENFEVNYLGVTNDTIHDSVAVFELERKVTS